jgi:predicted HicB family RNase H-like nuclease|nr:MAG TPA: Alginate and motility regulator [Caudoviricetes sp.]
MYTEARKRATAKYMKENLEDIKIRVPKGERDKYKLQAAAAGMSLNAYIIKLMDDDRERLAEAIELLQSINN